MNGPMTRAVMAACMTCFLLPPAARAEGDERDDPVTAERQAGSTEWLKVRGNRFRLYGFPRLDMIYTDSRLVPNNQFPFWVMSEDPTIQPDDDDEELDIHPRLTRLGVEVERDEIPMWTSAKLSGKIELDFQNGGSESREAVRMRHAFIKVVDESGLHFLAGQTWDLVSPLFPGVNADGMQWNAGNTGDRRPQFRAGYTGRIDENATWDITAAIARRGAINNRDLDGDGTADGIDSGKPMISGRAGVAKLFHGLLDAGVWGMVAWEDTDLGVAGETDFGSNLIGLDLQINITPELAVRGEFWSGENLDDVRGGIGQGINATTGEEIAAQGGWAEVKVALTPWYTPVLGFTIDTPDDGDLDPTIAGGARENNRAIYFSNHFNLGGGLLIGLEVINWETEYAGGLDDGDANRFNFWFIYKF